MPVMELIEAKKACTPLHDACRLKDPAHMVEYLLSEGADPNAKMMVLDFDSQYLLPFISIFLSGVEYNPARTPLILFLQSLGDAPCNTTVASLLEHYTGDLDEALVVASEEGHFEAVHLLLRRGANPNARMLETTPLCQAAKSSRLDVARLLVAHGADVNARNKAGQTPLTCLGCYPNRSMIKFLLEAGAEPGCAMGRPHDGSSADYTAKGAPPVVDYEESKIEAVTYMCAAKGGAPVLEMLLGMGLLQAFTHKQWQSMMMDAAHYGEGNVIRMLVEKGFAHIMERDANGYSAEDLIEDQYCETCDTIYHLMGN